MFKKILAEAGGHDGSLELKETSQIAQAEGVGATALDTLEVSPAEVIITQARRGEK